MVRDGSPGPLSQPAGVPGRSLICSADDGPQRSIPLALDGNAPQQPSSADDVRGGRSPAVWGLDPGTAALLRVGVLAAIGSPEVCLEWSATRALAVGATEDEITGVLLAIAPVIGLGRMVGAVPGVAGAFGYDI